MAVPGYSGVVSQCVPILPCCLNQTPLMLLLGKRNFTSWLICSFKVQPCFQKLWGYPKYKPDKAREFKMQKQTYRGYHCPESAPVSRAHPWSNSDIQWPVHTYMGELYCLKTQK